ncbi:MAG: SDR family oxidoreductase, partial [Psychrobacter alimentarius]
NAALFLLSPWASGVTGEIMFVDAGFNTVAISEQLMLLDEPKQ